MSTSTTNERNDLPNVWADFARFTSNGTNGALLGDLLSCSQKCMAWNTEIAEFFGHRISDDGQTFLAMVQCGDVPKALEIQQAWLRRAAEDYIAGTKRFWEFNGGIAGSLFQPAKTSADASKMPAG